MTCNFQVQGTNYRWTTKQIHDKVVNIADINITKDKYTFTKDLKLIKKGKCYSCFCSAIEDLEGAEATLLELNRQLPQLAKSLTRREYSELSFIAMAALERFQSYYFKGRMILVQNARASF